MLPIQKPTRTKSCTAADGPRDALSQFKSSQLLHSRLDKLYSITERRVPELNLVLGSQHAGDVSHKSGGRLPLLSARPKLPSQPLRGLLPALLLGEQRHDGCEQFASDCYPTASRLRFEPRPFCTSTLTTRLPSHPNKSTTNRSNGALCRRTCNTLYASSHDA